MTCLKDICYDYLLRVSVDRVQLIEGFLLNTEIGIIYKQIYTRPDY